LLALSIASSPVPAAKRVALGIGNNGYGILPGLNNARKNAEGMAAKLRTLGFEVILKVIAGERTIGRALVDFDNCLARTKIGLVFYAVHGIRTDGKNHLILSDARIEIGEDLPYEWIEAAKFLEQNGKVP